MNKVFLLTDSACDLELDVAKANNIKILGFDINIDGIDFKETIEKTKNEVYELMDNSDNIPKTAQITPIRFEEEYLEAYKNGYTDIIYVSISETASATHKNSVIARDNFFESTPEAKGKINIYIVDSKGYTAMYGYPLLEAAKKIRNSQANAQDLVAYFEEWFEYSAAIVVAGNLKYAKKSGRISAAAAFAGELLGIKPVIQMADGGSKILSKIRGEKNIIPKLMECIESKMTPQTPYIMLMGKNDKLTKELEKEMVKKYGYKPEYTSQIGAAISANIGPDVAGVVIKRKEKED